MAGEDQQQNLPSPIPAIQPPVEIKAVGSPKQPTPETGSLQDEVKHLNNMVYFAIFIMAAAIVAALIAYISLIWNVHIWSASMYEKYIDKIDEGTKSYICPDVKNINDVLR